MDLDGRPVCSSSQKQLSPTVDTSRGLYSPSHVGNSVATTYSISFRSWGTSRAKFCVSLVRMTADSMSPLWPRLNFVYLLSIAFTG